MKNQVFAILTCLIIFSAKSQSILISTGGTVPVSTGAVFYDAGGAAGNDGNTNYTITLEPATAGDRVCVDFTYFKTNFKTYSFGSNDEDALFIYDGTTATGNDIGKLMGDYTAKTSSSSSPIRVGMQANSISADIFTPTIFCATNSSGSLTFKFTNNSSATYPGWVGNITTYTPSTVGCNITLTADETSICPGETVNLTATGTLVSAGINTNFNNSNIGSGWAASSSASFTSSVCSAPSLDNSVYLWMQNAGAPRELKTNPMNISNGSTISFEYRQAKFNSDGSPCEAPDINGSTNEGIYLQYSTNGGTSWSTFKYLFSHSLLSNSGTADAYNNGCGEYVTRWTKMTYPIPSAAYSSSTQFRWIQPLVTSASTDNWGLDNVIISSPKPVTIRLKKNAANGTVIASSTTSPLNFAINPTVTTTYFATISDGIDSCTQQITIVVDPAVTPTFTQLGPYCLNATPAALPTSSTNNPAITGTWSPAAINTSILGNTTYTFTPTAGQCATTTTMVVNITNSVTPTFTQLGPYCLNATPAALPTSSTNNPAITGTWSPAAINTATLGNTTYTFTPTTGQCASTTTMVVNVTNSVTPTFTQLGPYCLNATPAALPASSTNATAITGTWSPAAINTATLGNTTYTFTPTAGQCASNTTMVVNITNSVTPTFTQLGPYCLNATPAALPASSTNATAINGTWSPAAINTATLGNTTYTFTPNAGQCASTTTMVVNITNSITPTFTQLGPYCLNATPAALPASSTNATAINGTWSPAAINTATLGNTTYTFTPSTGQCASTTTMVVNVTNSITPTFTQLGAYCLNSTPAALPASSTNATAITGTWSPASISTATLGNTTYTFTPATGQCAGNTTMVINVTNSITPTFTQLGPYCLNSTQVTLPLASTNNPAISGTWNTASISTTTAGTTSYTFTPSSGQCAGTTTMDIEINPLPVVSFNASPISGCSPLKTAFTNNSTDVQSVVWNFGNGQTSTLLNPIDIVYVQSGCYDVTLTVISTDQCTNTLTQNDIVCVDISPIADFTSSNSIISSENSTITFLNQSENATTYSWNFGDGSNSTLTSPSHNFNTSNNQNFTIELIAYSQNGCTDTSYTVIQIEEDEIYYVPNSFTPDGNEFNNIFKPVFNNQISEENYSLLIFNRWGELIFESNEKNKGWDGTYNNEKCKNDTYTWKIIFSNIKNDDRKEIVGHVNLLN